DEEIGVVVSLLAPHRQRKTDLRAGGFRQLRLELPLQEPVGRTLVHEQRRQACAILDQRAGIMAAPRCPVWAKVTAQRLLAPGAIHR
ncbi:MAG: hypothetical protein JWP08_3146, partial [Bryobacterales bacterium]|nr:hypothetical protein [Bryobacterales bacterium]